MPPAAPAVDPHIGRTLGGKYRIEALIGEGGMGRVYRGVQLSVNRPVAIKLIIGTLPHPPEWIERFRREAEATALLSHPNSVRLFDFGVTDAEELYMVMELLEGSNLALHLLKHGRMPLSAALRITRHVLLALSEAHALGIVHRDIKPDNVFLARVRGGDMIAKVMDFGIAGLEHSGSHVSNHKLTITGVVIGTPAYMSPEQAQGLAVDARGDLYSVGVMLFEMLTCQQPFISPNTVSLLVAHVTQPPRRLSEAGIDFPQRAATQALLDAFLAKDPARRPSIEAALTSIDALLAGRSTVVTHVPPPLRSRTGSPLSAIHPDTAISRSSTPSKATHKTITPLATETPPQHVTTWKTRIRARHTPGLFTFCASLALAGAATFALRYAPDFMPATRRFTARAAAAAAIPAPVQTRHVTINSQPSGASVWLNGYDLGKTPYPLQYDKATELSLVLRGYEERAVHIAEDSPSSVSIKLVREKPTRPGNRLQPMAATSPDSRDATVSTAKPEQHDANDPYDTDVPSLYVQPVPRPQAQPETSQSAVLAAPVPNPGPRPYESRSWSAASSDWSAPLTPSDVTPSQQDPAARVLRHAIARFFGRVLIQPPEPERRAQLLRQSLPFPNVRAAWVAYDSTTIDRTTFHEAIWMLRERRRQRTEATEARFARGQLTRDGYVKQHELIGMEFWGD